MAEEFYDPGAQDYSTNIELLGVNLDPANKEFGLYKPDIVKFIRSIEPYRRVPITRTPRRGAINGLSQ
jgi:hypothetical protein